MSGDDQDVVSAEMLLTAAAEIKRMASTRPLEAPAMLERARYLVMLAEQIRRDWGQRFGVDAGTLTSR
jgi:hypothetical protein